MSKSSRQRIRITLQEEKRGWRWIRQSWYTPNGFAHKVEDRSQTYYATAVDALVILELNQRQLDRETGQTNKL